MTRTNRRLRLGALGTAVAVSSIAVLPLHLTGTLAPQIMEELQFGTIALGTLVALNRLSAALSAPILGRLADRHGGTHAIYLASALALVSALGITLIGRNVIVFAIFLMVAGASQALSQPAANRILATQIRTARLGISFGTKQASQPLSGLLAGISVPLIALTLGWRWAFAAISILALGVLLSIRRKPPSAGASPIRALQAAHSVIPEGSLNTLIPLTVAFSLATASSASATTFYVQASTVQGADVARAGTMFAIASGAALMTRVLSGAISDYMAKGHLLLCSCMLAVGAVGFSVLAAHQTSKASPAIILALAGSWGFNGVFWYSLIRRYPGAPGRVTGVIFPGGLLGGTVGPMLFGLLGRAGEYRAAWTVVAGASLASALLMGAVSVKLTRQEAEGISQGGTMNSSE